MIRCIPTGLCSWNFRLDVNGHSASADFNWMTEQGMLTIDGERHDVEKHGPFSGHWTLVSKSSEVLAANKPSDRE